MTSLSAPLAALGQHQQFVLWRSIEQADGTKPRKVPCGPDGSAIDPHNPVNWMENVHAHNMAHATGWGVGFVLTDADPFFCIDVDNCGDGDGNWSQAALDIIAAFPGAAVEVSVSGKGLHIWGVGTVPEGYKTKNIQRGIEVYHNKRYIALGTGAVGDAWKDWTGVLSAWVPAHMEASTGGDLATGWTTEPRSDYTGNWSDEELIQKMVNSHSVAGTMGTKASVRQLWEADPVVLGQYFPDSGERAYDASSADSALATHLVFWTGANCDRMNRIMRMSGLARPKWDQHPSYMNRTIGGVVARGGAVYDKPVAAVPVTEVGAVGRYGVTTVDEQNELFIDSVYVIKGNYMFTMPGGHITKPDSFKGRFGGHEFLFTIDGKSTRNAFEAFIMQQLPNENKKVEDTWFRPDLPEMSITNDAGGSPMLNTYIDPRVKITHDNVSPFLDWFAKAFPNTNDRTSLMSYMAAMIQYPGQKFYWCPVIQGVKGNGKSMLSDILKYAIGGPDHNYCHPVAASNLDNGGLKFNSWIEGNIYIEIDEIHTRDKHSIIEALKPYITNRRIEVQGKGVDQRKGYNCANFCMFSNHKDAIHITDDERRYAVYYMGQQSKAELNRDYPGNYLPDLWEWLRQGGYEAMGGYLRTFAIPPEFNPTGAAHRAPKTSHTDAAIRESLGVVESFVVECFEGDDRGFRGSMCSSYTLDTALKSAGLANRVHTGRRKALMEGLGYVPHPALPGGRSTLHIAAEDGKKPIIYVHKKYLDVVAGHEPRWAVIEYMRLQGYPEQV